MPKTEVTPESQKSSHRPWLQSSDHRLRQTDITSDHEVHFIGNLTPIRRFLYIKPQHYAKLLDFIMAFLLYETKLLIEQYFLNKLIISAL